jgi:hypothetical protein
MICQEKFSVAKPIQYRNSTHTNGLLDIVGRSGNGADETLDQGSREHSNIKPPGSTQGVANFNEGSTLPKLFGVKQNKKNPVHGPVPKRERI